LSGLKTGGIIVVNSPSPPQVGEGFHCYWVDAGRIASRLGLGTVNHPVVNTTMIGAFAKATGMVGMEHVEKAFNRLLEDGARKNVEAALYAYRKVVSC